MLLTFETLKHGFENVGQMSVVFSVKLKFSVKNELKLGVLNTSAPFGAESEVETCC